MRQQLNKFLTFALLASACALPGCPPVQRPPQRPSALKPPALSDVRWHIISARGEATFLKLELPIVVAGTRITLGNPATTPATSPTTNLATAPDTQPAETQPAPTAPASPGAWRGSVALYSTHLVRGPVEGPQVEQLSGLPRQSTDAGSYLVPLKIAPADSPEQAASPGDTFVVADPMPLYFKVSVPPTTDPGTYILPVQIAAPGKPVETTGISVEVTDIALSTEPRVLAVATTNLATLADIYPETFGTINAQYLDRDDLDAHPAVAQLDALIKAARAEGVALFVEDIVPVTRVDEMGQVTLDWDAYDRLLQPYMDGSAFADRVPLPVWLAPVPPRRIRDSSTQLWQYIDLCAKHFAEKKWVAVPAFLHPAIGQDTAAARSPQSAKEADDQEKLRAQVSDMMRLHMPREMLAVASPGADVPHGQLWTVNDDDPRLPPAGPLASEFSVRAWPWMCVARGNESGAGGIGGNGGSPTGVKGLVWRNALSSADALSRDLSADPLGSRTARPLFVIERPDPRTSANGAPGRIMPTLRMTWLAAGLNDAALVDLLEHRADTGREGMVSEILAGMAGRTGLANDHPQILGSSAGWLSGLPTEGLPPAPTGFLYAGWPADKAIWSQVTPNLQKLILAADPETRGTLKPDDPAYLAAKLWLAGTRRAVARLAGYDMALRQGARGGSILDMRLRLLLENPVNLPADMDLRFSNLPGDFELAPPPASPAAAPRTTTAPGLLIPAPQPDDPDEGAVLRRRRVTLPGSSLTELTLPLAGHVGELLTTPPADFLEIAEHFNGATLHLPVQLPIYRLHALEDGQPAPKLDGKDDDWPLDNMTRVFGEMPIATHYLARPDLLAGALRTDDHPAHVRWTYDNDYLYMLAVCPQDGMTEDRNTEWPLITGAGGTARWWGSDGLQIELAALPGAPNAGATDRIVKIAFKPAGVVLVQTGQIAKSAQGPTLRWKDGPPPPPQGAPAAIKYGISVQRSSDRVTSYTIEAAIPRTWLDAPTPAAPAPPGPTTAPSPSPAWRLNILRHRASDLMSTSWSGPLVEDNDVGMMGALVGE